jgi:hypothetical protein
LVLFDNLGRLQVQLWCDGLDLLIFDANFLLGGLACMSKLPSAITPVARRQWNGPRGCLACHFLEEHKNADEIVMDTEAGWPVKAVYTTVRGVPREHIATYWFSESE